MNGKTPGDDRSSDLDSLAREELKKTELKEVPHVPEGARVKTMDPSGILVKMAKRAAMETISEEVALFKKLVEETDDVNQKLEFIERLANLKLRAVGIVLGGMTLNRR